MIEFVYNNCRPWVVSLIGLVFAGGMPLRTCGEESRNRYAVLVGIQGYEHADLRTPPLKYSVNDVMELNGILRGASETLLLDIDCACAGAFRMTALLPRWMLLSQTIQI